VQITECWDIIVVTSLVPLDSAMLFIHQISLWLVVHSYIVFLLCRDPSEPYTSGVERERERRNRAEHWEGTHSGQSAICPGRQGPCWTHLLYS
jgi:hypothetical protein